MRGEGLIKGLIFDFDGTILDTETPEYLAWQAVFAAHGTELPLAVWGRAIGTAAALDPHAYLEERCGRPVDRAAVDADRHARYRELMAAETVRPGVTEYLAAAGDLGLRLGLASSSSRPWVEGYLADLGLLGRFETIRTSEDVARVKPDPALYRRVLADLGLVPAEAIAVEDSPNGARAARAAGLFCLAVPTPVTRALAFDAVDLRLESLADLPLAAVMARAAGLARDGPGM